MERGTTRRALLGSALLAPIATAACASPVSAVPPRSADPRWAALVTAYRGAREAWVSECDWEDDVRGDFAKACKSLPPEPTKPPFSESGLPDDINDMTIRQIKATEPTPEVTAAWADYERDQAAWKEQRDTLKENILGPLRAQNEANYAAYDDALDNLTSYPVLSLVDLAEKIAILAADYSDDDLPSQRVMAILEDVRRLAGEARS